MSSKRVTGKGSKITSKEDAKELYRKQVAAEVMALHASVGWRCPGYIGLHGLVTRSEMKRRACNTHPGKRRGGGSAPGPMSINQRRIAREKAAAL